MAEDPSTMGYRDLNEWAQYLKEAFNTLVAHGFTEQEAFELIRAALMGSK